jgi:hypothetical protein
LKGIIALRMMPLSMMAFKIQHNDSQHNDGKQIRSQHNGTEQWNHYGTQHNTVNPTISIRTHLQNGTLQNDI